MCRCDDIAGLFATAAQFSSPEQTQVMHAAARVPSASDQGRRTGYRLVLEQAGERLDIVELERHVVQRCEGNLGVTRE